MPRIMMRCTRNWNNIIHTGIEATRKAGLRGYGETVITCPSCGRPHFLKQLFFEGDEPGPVMNEALDCAPGFSAEIGAIFGTMGIIEGYIPRLFEKLCRISISDATVISGTLSYSQKLNLADNLVQTRDKKDLVAKEVKKLISKLRSAGTIRDKYAHAQYGIAGDCMHVRPFFGDVRKKPTTLELTVDDVASDLTKVRSVSNDLNHFMFRDF
jgi:hypothetical protein